MPRLRNVDTGVVVDVDDETAAALNGFEAVESKKPAPAKKAASAKIEK